MDARIWKGSEVQLPFSQSWSPEELMLECWYLLDFLFAFLLCHLLESV